ncbi:aminopeptidase [Patescibacteria group bacterium]|nr:aminopeptidase [Patescibacteria group bacterium]
MASSYEPSRQVLENYAKVLINFALNSGEGVKPGEVVQCAVPDVASRLGLELQNTLLKAGAHPIIRLLPTGFEKDFYELANDEQLTFFPADYYRARVKLIDHQVGIIADVHPEELKDVDPQKITKARDARDPYRRWLMQKEVDGKFTWTLGLWGVQAKADEVGLSLEEYWEQIIRACYLDHQDPVAEWQKMLSFQNEIKSKLNALEIDWLDIKGEDIDLRIQLGQNRIWQGGSGRNVPSFEFFTSPNWRGTSGRVHFNQPLYRYGNVLRDIDLRFENGQVVEAHARIGNSLLQQMLKSENADKIGEYSLTDKRMSRITHVMAETLYDENIGGPFGNTHLAIGMAYKDCYRGDAGKVTKAEWEEFGYNDSPEHTDIVSTTDRTVTATLCNGVQKVIYKDGMFVL